MQKTMETDYGTLSYLSRDKGSLLRDCHIWILSWKLNKILQGEHKWGKNILGKGNSLCERYQR